MSGTVTFRVDVETARILRELTRRRKVPKSKVVRDALREYWKSSTGHSSPDAWEVYQSLKLPTGRPRRDRARHDEEILTETLRAKRRTATL